MAAIGKVGSFATVQPSKDSIGAAMSATEDAGFKYREEERLANEAKEKKQEADEKILQENLANYKGKATGISNLDNISQELATESAKNYAQNTRVLNNPNAPAIEKEKARLANMQIKRQFDNSQAYMQMIIDKKNEIAELTKKGDLNPQDEKDLLNDLKSFENMSARVDENGIWRFSSYQKDDKGNIVGTVVNDTDINGILNTMTRFKKPQFQEFKKTFIANNPLRKDKIQRVFTTTTTELIAPEQKESARLAAIALSRNNDEAYQRWFDIKGEKKRDFNEDERAILAKSFEEDLLKGWKETYEKDIDQAGALANRKFNEEKEEKRVIISEPVVAVKTGVIPGTKTVSKEGEKTFAIQRAEKKLGDGKIERLKEVRLRPDGSAIYVVEETYEGASKRTEQLTPEGQRKEAFNKANAKDISEGKVAPEEITFNDIITVTETTKAPTVKTYDTNERGNEASVFAIMAENPKTGKKFKGANELNEYLFEQAGFKKQPEEQKKETPAERAKRIAGGN